MIKFTPIILTSLVAQREFKEAMEEKEISKIEQEQYKNIEQEVYRLVVLNGLNPNQKQFKIALNSKYDFGHAIEMTAFDRVIKKYREIGWNVKLITKGHSNRDGDWNEYYIQFFAD
jgi:hypothetical protein